MSSNGDLKDIISNVTSNSAGNKFTIFSFLAALILLSYTGYDTVIYRTDVISEFSELNEYRITFTTQNETMQAVKLSKMMKRGMYYLIYLTLTFLMDS